jgi:hypothetical protein
MSEDYTDISAVELPGNMWPLRWFHYDEGIDSPEVYLLAGASEAELMSLDEALAIARSRGLHLVPEWPEHLTTGPALCRIAMVSLPVRWERLPEPERAAEPDPLLWFEAPCGGRDLLAGNGGTFHGRMRAWCPDKQVSYNVSLAEMGQMPQEARYWVAGFLAGNQPGPPPPPDFDADTDPGDLVAWRSAIGRFHRTGQWFGRWRTCQACGRVLLPDTVAENCQEHIQDQSA